MDVLRPALTEPTNSVTGPEYPDIILSNLKVRFSFNVSMRTANFSSRGESPKILGGGN